jgi:hypothetical protein
MIMSTQPATDTDKRALNKRLESIAFGLFLIMMGGLALIPKSSVPQGLWALGAGLVLLGLNAARRYYGIKMSTGTIVLGLIALSSGAGDLLGIKLPLLEILIIVAGVNMLFNALFGKRDHEGPGQ